MENLRVREALHIFHEIFPNIELDEFLNNSLDLPLDHALDYIISNENRFKMKAAPNLENNCDENSCLGDTIEFEVPDLEHTVEKIECSVCFNSFPRTHGFGCVSTTHKIECVHIFCVNCVRGQANASISDSQVSADAQGLCCMAPGCNNSILFAKIAPYLSSVLRSQLEKRLNYQAIANIQQQLGLEHCRRCDYAAEMRDVPVEENKVFQCLNPSCGFEYCRCCGADWAKHFGKTCIEASSKKHEFETKLNEAVVRICPKCNLQFVKSQDCNFMTCRCGCTMCYLCRLPFITEKHFCVHRGSSQVSCNIDGCSGCLQFQSFKKIDLDAIERVRKEYLESGGDAEIANVNAANFASADLSDSSGESFDDEDEDEFIDDEEIEASEDDGDDEIDDNNDNGTNHDESGAIDLDEVESDVALDDFDAMIDQNDDEKSNIVLEDSMTMSDSMSDQSIDNGFLYEHHASSLSESEGVGYCSSQWESDWESSDEELSIYSVD